MSQPSAFAEAAPLIDLDMTFLPVAQMRQITRVTQVEGAAIEGEMELGPDHWIWPQHFPNDPIFPGTLMIEAAGQLVALWAWAHGARGRPRLVRTGAEFHNPVERRVPGLRLTGEVRRKRNLYFGSVQIAADGVAVATVQAVLVILQPSSSTG
jgi:3-hydroxymyristoyl/3-hydroxydecanoyl-(acyl carrier protein) dehydratase